MDVAITKEHGRIIEQDDRIYLLTFHPAAVLHNPTLPADLQEDFRKLRRLLREV